MRMGHTLRLSHLTPAGPVHGNVSPLHHLNHSVTLLLLLARIQKGSESYNRVDDECHIVVVIIRVCWNIAGTEVATGTSLMNSMGVSRECLLPRGSCLADCLPVSGASLLSVTENSGNSSAWCSCCLHGSNPHLQINPSPKLITHPMQGASPMASRLSSQHASHSSTPAHTSSQLSSAAAAAAATSAFAKPQEQQLTQQNGGVQVMQVCSLPFLACSCSCALQGDCLCISDHLCRPCPVSLRCKNATCKLGYLAFVALPNLGSCMHSMMGSRLCTIVAC